MHIIGYAVLVSIIADIIASVFWNASYCRSGFPIYKRQIFISSVDVPLTSDEVLTDELKSGMDAQDMVFKPISKLDVAFREKLFNRWLSGGGCPVMQGLITISPDKSAIEVQGLLKWPVIVMCLGGFVFFVSVDSIAIVLFPLLFILVASFVYLLQREMFNRITEYLRAKYEGSPSPPAPLPGGEGRR